MIRTLLADATLVIHLLFILFVVAGGFTVLWRRWFALIHIPAVAWAVVLEFFGLICPLTYLENWLRYQGGATGYSGGFIAYYLLPIIYPTGLTPQIQFLLGSIALGLNLSVYCFVWFRVRRSKRKNH